MQHKRTGGGQGSGSYGGGGYGGGGGGYSGGGYRGVPINVHSPAYAQHGNTSSYYPVSAPPTHTSLTSRYPHHGGYDLPENGGGGRYGGGHHGHMQPPSPPGGGYDPQYGMYFSQQTQQQYRDVPEPEDPRLRRKQPTPPGVLEDVSGRAPSRDSTPLIGTDGVDGLTQTFDKALRMPAADA